MRGQFPLPPYRVAPDTFVIPEMFPAEPGTFVAVNSAVILGAEPIVVDTGTALNRPAWLESLWSLVEPADVRWVFLSHDDHDHVGNLLEVLEACPAATLVSSWFATERLSGDLWIPPSRLRWVNDGDTFEAGGRELVALRPPIWDSPTTRGLYDPATGFYWGGDSFASLVAEGVGDAADLDGEFWERSFLDFQRMLAPWHTLLDSERWLRHIDRLRRLDVTVVASGHGPATSGPRLEKAFELLARIADLPPVAMPGQQDLDALVAAATEAA